MNESPSKARSTITVIICTYNRCESLRDTLQALKTQVLNPRQGLEIIVVDNNSTDQTRAVVAHEAISSSLPIRYVFEPTQGLSHARNRGIRESKAAIVAFTDDDVVPDTKWVDALVEIFKSYQADCISGRVTPLWLQPPPAWMVNQGLWSYVPSFDKGDVPKVISGEDQVVGVGANMAFRRGVFDEVGNFRTDLGYVGKSLLGGEDTEILKRCFAAGKRIVYAPDALVHHKIEPYRVGLGYLRRWRFRVGQTIGLITTEKTQNPRVPLWLVRECFQHASQAMWCYCLRRRDVGIQKELQFWVQLGQIVGIWNAKKGAAA